MQYGFQVFPFTRVLAIEELQQPHHKRLVYVLLGRLCLCVVGDYIPQQEFVHYLQQAGHSVGCHCFVRRPGGGRNASLKFYYQLKLQMYTSTVKHPRTD